MDKIFVLGKKYFVLDKIILSWKNLILSWTKNILSGQMDGAKEHYKMNRIWSYVWKIILNTENRFEVYSLYTIFHKLASIWSTKK